MVLAGINSDSRVSLADKPFLAGLPPHRASVAADPVARSTLPLVEIHTWNDTVSLVNATVVAIVPPVRHSTGKGSTGSKGLNTHEMERIEIAFQKIDITFNGSGKKGKGALDNWNVPT